MRQVGSTNAMRVVGRSKDGAREVVALYAHEDLETCVGVAIAAFVAQMLLGRVEPGVYYPEEAFAAPEARDRLFELGTKGAFTWIRPKGVGGTAERGKGEKAAAAAVGGQKARS